MTMESIIETVDGELFGVWFLIGAALVFFYAVRLCNG